MKPYLAFAFVVCAILVLIGLSARAAPKFYTPRMIERRGLTDAQYDYLWSIGRNPHVDQRTARNWYVRSSQNDNFCNWLDTDGKSNELSRLTRTLATNNVHLADSNIRLSGENANLVVSNAVLEVDAKKAQKVEKAAEKAKRKDGKNFEKWVSDTEKAKKKSSDEMAEFYDSILEMARAYGGT